MAPKVMPSCGSNQAISVVRAAIPSTPTVTGLIKRKYTWSMASTSATMRLSISASRTALRRPGISGVSFSKKNTRKSVSSLKVAL
ncbi:Uncharacterised protein [Vibrio cholerae]|nr:Uncharacterised protein [Vibrio cholerae]